MRSVMSCWVIPEARNRSSSCVLSVSNGKTITEGPRSCGASSELRMCWVQSQPPKTATRIRAVTSSFNPNGHSRFGQGDLLTEVAIIAPPPSLRLGYGLGVRAVWPTAGLNEAGDGKYQVGPVAAARLSLPEISAGSSFLTQVLYLNSVASRNENKSRADTNQLNIQPKFNVSLPDGWFLTTYASENIQINSAMRANCFS